MTADACLQLVHSSRRRRRYTIRSASPIQWTIVEARLAAVLPALHLHGRVNRNAGSIVLEHRPPRDGLVDTPERSETVLRQGLQALVSALEAAGATAPAAQVIQINTRIRRPRGSGLGRLAQIVLNAASGSVSLVLFLLAAGLLTLGLIGLMLPLAPGAPLLLLGCLIIELALALRRPFVATTPV